MEPLKQLGPGMERLYPPNGQKIKCERAGSQLMNILRGYESAYRASSPKMPATSVRDQRGKEICKDGRKL